MARVAIVTGGTRGIGEAISLALMEQGARWSPITPATTPRRKPSPTRTAFQVYKWDVGDHHACLDGVRAGAEEVGPVDMLVNNAGITRDGDAAADELRRLERRHATPTSAAASTWPRRCSRACATRGCGRIVNIGSINGQAGQYGQVNYAAAKSGIHGFTKALAQEGAPSGITVNAIAPGYIDTDMVARGAAEVLEKIVAKIPVGRLGKAEEIARGVVSWSPTTPASSPARRCRSTAASTCTDKASLPRSAGSPVASVDRVADDLPALIFAAERDSLDDAGPVRKAGPETDDTVAVGRRRHEFLAYELARFHPTERDPPFRDTAAHLSLVLRVLKACPVAFQLSAHLPASTTSSHWIADRAAAVSA